MKNAIKKIFGSLLSKPDNYVGNQPEKSDVVSYIKEKKVLNRNIDNSESLLRSDITFGEILNDKYFSNIKWNILKYNENVYIVNFSGEPIGTDLFSDFSITLMTDGTLRNAVGISSVGYMFEGQKMICNIDSTSQETMEESNFRISMLFETAVINISKTFQVERFNRP